MDPRATDSVFLRPCGNIQGGFYALDLSTEQRIHRMHSTPVPRTDTIIAQAISFATKEKVPVGIIFGNTNNNNTILDMDFEEDNHDGDDASDVSYKDNNDDTSNEGRDDTVVSYDSAIMEVNQADNLAKENEDKPLAQGDNNNDQEDEEEVVETANKVSDSDTVGSKSTDAITENDSNSAHKDNGAEHLNDDNTEEDDNLKDTPVTNDDNDPVATVNKAEEPDPNRQMGLRPTVTRTHNKFGESNGLATSVIHCGLLFTAGYGLVLEKMSRDEVSYMCVAASIAEYNSIKASKATKQYRVRKGIKSLGKDGVNTVLKELKQMHDRTVVVPIKPEDVTKKYGTRHYHT